MINTSHKLYTARQVRGIDSAAINELGIGGYELMCRAGRAVIEDAQLHFPSATSWLIMCGPGNNGGDGYVVARLAAETGVEVTVCSLVDPEKLTGDAGQAYADWKHSGGQVEQWPLSKDEQYDLALDALLGTGIDREVGGDFKHAIAFLNKLECPKLAIDIPSGLNADTGRVMGCAVQARSTVTFVGRKRGMHTLDGPDHSGNITFDDLAIPAEAAEGSLDCAGQLLEPGFLASVIKPRLRNSHKGHFGHLLCVGGIQGMSGAIRLCGEAALRSGAGRVTLATDPAHASLVNLARPELMVKSIGTRDDLQAVLNGGLTLAVGPGLGETDWSETLLQACLETDAMLVVDADGLNMLARYTRDKPLLRGQWVLTPHPAEAARLLACSISDVQADRVHAAQTIARDYGASTVLKGCGTVVAEPGGAYAICPSGNPGMATAGSGDVLTGIIAALLGQGLTCFDAARTGTLAHAMAGDLAAAESGEMALVAVDIIDFLPDVWRESGL